MAIVSVAASFKPEVLKAFKKEDVTMTLKLSNSDNSKSFWCECEISVKSPLSLAHDKELGKGRSRIGILKPNGAIEKQIKLFTRPNNFADDYVIVLTIYVYDEDGAIAERFEQNQSIKCVD